MNWKIVSLGFLLLFTSSFFDNIRGPLLPILANTFHLTHSDSSLFLIAGSLGGIIATFLLIPFTKKYTEREVLGGLLLFSIGTIIFSFFIENYVGLLFFGLGMGMSISSLGAMANLVTMQGCDAENRSRTLSLLHTMYGIGSFIAPNLVGISLISAAGWRTPLIFLSLVLCFGLVYSLKVFPKSATRELVVSEPVKLTHFQIFTVLLFSTYVAGEVTASMWMVSYLVEVCSLTVTDGSNLLGRFFLMMLFTRGLTYLFLKEQYEDLVLKVSLLAAVVFFILGLLGNLWAFPLIGIFGPFFPVFLSRVTRLFKQQSKNITLWIIGVNAIFIMLFHRLVGYLSDTIGLLKAYWLPCGLLFLSLLLVLEFIRREKA